MKTKIILIFVVALTIGACGDNKTLPIPGSGQNPDPNAGKDGVETVGRDINGGDAGTAIGNDIIDWRDINALKRRNVIYFGFNSAQVEGEDLQILNAHAKYIANNPSARVRLEGHADERGSREYNVALSENRTISARRLMTFQGISASQTNIIAYGEERPQEFCQSERCWGKNRRVEIIYEAQ